MNRAKRMLFSGIVVLVLACGLIQSAWGLNIGEILAKPDEYYDRSVTVSGKVMETFEMMVRLFGVEDSTGQIRIKTDQPMPKILSEVEVTGIVTKEMARDGKNYPMIKEESRKVLKEGKK